MNMAKVVFADYAMVDKGTLNGFMVVNVTLGVNAADSGIMIELERIVDNVTLGIDILYDPDNEELETPLLISQEYVKHIAE